MRELDALRSGGKRALAQALAGLETAPTAENTLTLLDEAWSAGRAQRIGITGPPGVGKSTLLSALVQDWRAAGTSVAVIAVDPSSARSGGALLGDRTRLELDPDDAGVFVRSLAARDRLGGVAALCGPAATLLAALYDLVVIETVGVGQSEVEVRELVDTLVLAVQPASGDALQFMKAGIMEVPDLVVVTKADQGEAAERTARELAGWGAAVDPGVLLVAAPRGQGIAALRLRVAAHAASRAQAVLREQRARRWIEAGLQAEFGRRGLARARRDSGALLADAATSPERRLARLTAMLEGVERPS